MKTPDIIDSTIRFVLTWIAFGAMAILTYSFYPGFTDVTVFIYIALEVGAFGIAVYAAFQGIPRLDKSYKLLVILFIWTIVRTQMTKWRIFSPFSNVVLNLAFWTGFTAFALWTSYVVVYRWRLLDRDGPVGRAVANLSD